MINLKSYSEYVATLAATVNRNCEYHIDSTRLAVSEAHMIKKLNDARGVILCASFPDARGIGEDDCIKEGQQTFFFVVEKVAPGADDSNAEIMRYAKLQTIALALRDAILYAASNCMPVKPGMDYKIEWEWQIFGGYNGLSIGVKFENYD